MATSVQRKLQQVRSRLQSGDAAAAAALCEEVLQRAPRNPDALWLLGTAHILSGRPEDAVPLIEQAVSTVPNHGLALDSLGLAHLMLGQYGAAEQVLRQAAALHGAPPSVHMRLGIALLYQGQHGQAIAELERALAAGSEDTDTRINLGQAYFGAGRLADAAREFGLVAAQVPDNADALYNLGVVSLAQGNPERARSCFEQILAHTPSYSDARERLAAMHVAVGRFREATAQLREVVRMQPGNVHVLIALAGASFECGELDNAASAALRALELDPAQAGSYGVLAQIHFVRRELDRAATVLEEGYRRTSSHGLLGTLVHLLHRLCDWGKWAPLWQQMEAELETSADFGSPFSLLCENTTARQQLSYARRWAAARFAGLPERSPASHYTPGIRPRVRVGYFSPDFHEHATAYLLAEVLELHDRDRFEVFAYSYGPEDHSPMRARLRAAVEHFSDVAWEPDDLIVARMEADQLDLLVDLKGYTMGDRLGVMAQRPCATQLSWIGYPGTTAASFIDFLIADPFVIPTHSESAYTERILRLPHCYQPNDRKRPRIDPLARPEYGLPDAAFVFCCFNQTVKITPEVWACWVGLLRSAPNSILWLLEDNRWASEALLSSLASHDIERSRVIIAPRLPLAEHLARYRAADLALDTFPYTSHTTASDALWMGCPLVALCGETFASRVSGSVLSSCGLADLITYTLDEYEKLALRLATDATLMLSVRTRLASAHDVAPLFNSQQFVRDLEALYLQITP